jgi:hypothetical protein
MTVYRYKGEVVSKEQYQRLKQKEDQQFKRDVEQLLAEKKVRMEQALAPNKTKPTVKQFHNLINNIDSY